MMKPHLHAMRPGRASKYLRTGISRRMERERSQHTTSSDGRADSGYPATFTGPPITRELQDNFLIIRRMNPTMSPGSGIPQSHPT